MSEIQKSHLSNNYWL
ncbi:hypothetical protein YPPY66_4920, partial [Yersinia pestis PY-66]